MGSRRVYTMQSQVEAYLEYINAKGLSKGTIKKYSVILNLIKGTKLDDLERWYYGYIKEKSSAYRCFLYSVVYAYGDWLVMQGLISRNPLTKVPQPKQP